MEPSLSQVVLDKLEEISARFLELEASLGDPAMIGVPSGYRKVVREHGRWARIVTPYRAYKEVLARLREAESIIADPAEDPEVQELARDEIEAQRSREAELATELQNRLLAQDDDEDRNVIVEIRAGTGGEEAALFVSDLFGMYRHLAEARAWKVEVIEARPTDLGGLKEVVFSVQGNGANGALRFESGGHRVQRVPETEASGRIHTSAVTVAVLPEPEDVEVEIRDEDLRVDTFSASGPGGQHVNKTQSAVRITHLPTGIVASCQDEKSQHMNRVRAMRVLRSRVYDMLCRKEEEKRATTRRSMIGSGDRSERIRTYNFPQNRVTDHRIGLTLYALADVLQGGLDPVIAALREHDRHRRLEAL